MQTSHPTLLIGPSDWNAETMPKEEFIRRIEALWRAYPEAPCAIVYGNPAHHAELAYLTNLVPKLEAAVAMLRRTGEHEIHLGGGPNMLGAAKPLTFIEDLKPLRGGQAIGRRAAEAKEGLPGVPLMIGGGYMPMAMRRGIDETIGEPALEATPHVWTLMRRSSPHELHVMRESCLVLGAATGTMADAMKAGLSVTDAILAGEREANRRGAQDVRTLFSLDGGRTLAPFTTPVDARVDPLQVYVAVRRCNYWAEGFLVLSNRRLAVVEKANELLRRALAAIQHGTATAYAAELIGEASRPHHLHPVTERAIANRIGLALEEPPYTNAGAKFEAGEFYSIKVGITNDVDEHAIVSAMIRIRAGGVDVLWSA